MRCSRILEVLLPWTVGLSATGPLEWLSKELSSDDEPDEDEGLATMVFELSFFEVFDPFAVGTDAIAFASFFLPATFLFFLGASEDDVSKSESDSELDSEEEESLEDTFRFNLLIRPPTVAFVADTAPSFSVSSSASMSEVEDEPEE